VKKYILLGVIGVFFLSSGCLGLVGKKVGGDDKSIKKTQIAGVLAETKVEAKAKVDAKAEIKAKGVDLSKTITGGQVNQGVDMKTLMYIIGAFITLLTTIMGAVIADAKILAGRLMNQLTDARSTILDLGNDVKEYSLKIMPMFILMHNKEAFESLMKYKAEYEKEFNEKVREAAEKATIKKKKRFLGIFKRK